jgi:hypothetical protein
MIRNYLGQSGNSISSVLDVSTVYLYVYPMYDLLWRCGDWSNRIHPTNTRHMACGLVMINCGYSNLLASSDVVNLALAGLKRSKIFSAAQFTSLSSTTALKFMIFGSIWLRVIFSPARLAYHFR